MSAAFLVASDTFDALEEIFREIGAREIAGIDRSDESLRRLVLYLGTLLNEIFLGSSHLALLEMPRAQVVLNRQLFELSIRIQWCVSRPEDALRIMDSLPKFPYEEIRKSGASMSAEDREVIISNYEVWKTVHPDLDKTVNTRGKFTEMAREVLGKERAEKEMLLYYGVPSVVMHGKPHGIGDVMVLVEGKLERRVMSQWFDRCEELNRAVEIALELAAILTLAYKLDKGRIPDLSRRFRKTLIDQGIKPESLPVTLSENAI